MRKLASNRRYVISSQTRPHGDVRGAFVVCAHKPSKAPYAEYIRHIIILSGCPGSGKTAILKLLEERDFLRLNIDDFYQKAPRDPQIQNWSEERLDIFRERGKDTSDSFQHIINANRPSEEVFESIVSLLK